MACSGLEGIRLDWVKQTLNKNYWAYCLPGGSATCSVGDPRANCGPFFWTGLEGSEVEGTNQHGTHWRGVEWIGRINMEQIGRTSTRIILWVVLDWRRFDVIG